MCPTFNFNFPIEPFGNSKIEKYLGFQKNSLFGKNFSFIFTTFLLLSKTIIECNPNRVFKNIILSLNIIAPKVLLKRLFKWMTFESIDFPVVKFLSTKSLYMNCFKYQKGV